MANAVNDTDASLPAWEREWLAAERLPTAYAASARRWFAPLGARIAARRQREERPVLIGVNGSQGSGKSTCCAWLVEQLRHEAGLTAVTLSLDDFYRTRAEREELAASVHPLLATRGVPGTHDMTLLAATLRDLLGQGGTAVARVPRFDKATDDRRPRAAWDAVPAPVDAVFLEGWCLGAGPVASTGPALNDLEIEHDPDGRWRRYVNTALAREFLPLYEQVDLWVMLRAPSFECVYAWRLEQEHKLAARGAGGDSVMSDEQVARFVQYFERLTRHCLATLPSQMDIVYTLDADRRIVGAEGL